MPRRFAFVLSLWTLAFVPGILLLGRADHLIASPAGMYQSPAQTPPAPKPPPAEGTITAAQVGAAIDQLGALDYAVRTSSARTVRRAEPAIAVPALLQAVKQHKDEYVRFRALVLLSGFNDPRTRDVMAGAIADKNDRLRTVAYAYFEHNVDKTIVPRLLEALKTEESEFVRPQLTRALASYGDDPKVSQVMQGLVMQGQAFFRSVVIETIGDHAGLYALKQITEVAKTDGPLQDDAALTLGKLADKSVLPVLAGLQRTAPRESQPSVAAAICLLGVNCSSHKSYIVESLAFSIKNLGFQSLVRSSAAALGVLAVAGHEDALVELIKQGESTRDPVRAPIVLAIGTVALRNTALTAKVLADASVRGVGIDFLREAFDMLEEDFEEERFFATVRRAYWQAPAGSPARAVPDALIKKLEF